MEKIKQNKICRLISYCLFILYFWFGIQKFFPHVSPAEDIAAATIKVLTFGLITERLALNLLAIWEVGAAILIIALPCKKWVLNIFFVHLVFTFTPFLFFPSLTFGETTGSLSLLGQYIVKNILLLIAVYILYQFGDERQHQLTYSKATDL
jgi:uncharacterized membrane protein YkgB